jgi:hypothetical protein
MVTNEIVHLLVAPPQTVETSLVKEACLILQKDPYETRMLLSGKMPKLIAHYASAAAAEIVAQQLKTLGLVALAVNDIELNQFFENGFNARGVEFEEQAATFRDNNNRLLKLETKDVFLIIKGKYQVSSDKPVTATRLKFNLTATLVTGGIPIWSKVNETSKANSGETGYFVRIYDRDSPKARVEFFENSFNYSVLDTEIAPNAATNLNIIVTKLRAVFPQALFDDILTQPMGLSEAYDKKANAVELHCRLIYLYHRAVSKNP